MEFVYFIISAMASFVGAISGIGGGIIIKPLMDSLGTMSVSIISFLSGCTVLTMCTVSLIRNRKEETKINMDITLYLAIGACIGGILGKELFDRSRIIFGNDDLVGMTQSILLLLINLAIILYIKNKDKIKTYDVKDKKICVLIGLGLGMLSSFLGIGGGPLNIAAIYYFFSMKPKETALNSLFIIFFSQISSLLMTIITNSIPNFGVMILVVMCFGGVLGAIYGSHRSKKMNDNITQQFFSKVLILLVFINIFNIIKFMGVLQ